MSHLDFVSVRCPSSSAISWVLLSWCPCYVGEATGWLILDLHLSSGHWCRLSWMFLTQHPGVLGFLVFPIGCNQLVILGSRVLITTSHHHLISSLCGGVPKAQFITLFLGVAVAQEVGQVICWVEGWWFVPWLPSLHAKYPKIIVRRHWKA